MGRQSRQKRERKQNEAVIEHIEKTVVFVHSALEIATIAIEVADQFRAAAERGVSPSAEDLEKLAMTREALEKLAMTREAIGHMQIGLAEFLERFGAKE